MVAAYDTHTITSWSMGQLIIHTEWKDRPVYRASYFAGNNIFTPFDFSIFVEVCCVQFLWFAITFYHKLFVNLYRKKIRDLPTSMRWMWAFQVITCTTKVLKLQSLIVSWKNIQDGLQLCHGRALLICGLIKFKYSQANQINQKTSKLNRIPKFALNPLKHKEIYQNWYY
jgi:hypothetical protein